MLIAYERCIYLCRDSLQLYQSWSWLKAHYFLFNIQCVLHQVTKAHYLSGKTTVKTDSAIKNCMTETSLLLLLLFQVRKGHLKIFHDRLRSGVPVVEDTMMSVIGPTVAMLWVSIMLGLKVYSSNLTSQSLFLPFIKKKKNETVPFFWPNPLVWRQTFIRSRIYIGWIAFYPITVASHSVIHRRRCQPWTATASPLGAVGVRCALLRDTATVSRQTSCCQTTNLPPEILAPIFDFPITHLAFFLYSINSKVAENK